MIRLYAIPVLGEGKLISSLRVSDAHAILLALDKQGRAASTRRQAIIAFRKLAMAAADEHLLVQKHAQAIHPPKRGMAAPLTSLTVPQATEIASLMSTTSYDGRGAAILQLYTGARRSEALAARWEHIDGLNTAGRASWRITESVVEARGQLAFHDPKTRAGKRTVQLPEPARLALLHAIRKARPETTFVAESGKARQHDPRPVLPSNYSRWLRGIFDIVGAGGNSHAMRHAYAINALRAGVPLVTISRNLGHASITITADIYMDVEDRDLRRAADAVADMYAPKPNGDEGEVAS